MVHRIEVRAKPGARDQRGEKLVRQVALAGLRGLTSVATSDLYFIDGDVPVTEVRRLVDTLLVDDILEEGQVGGPKPLSTGAHSIEVTLLPGVTDSAAESLRTGAGVIGVGGLGQIAVGQRYVLGGSLTEADAKTVAERLIVNKVIQTYTVNGSLPAPFVHKAQYGAGLVETVALRQAGDDALLAISRARRLALDLAEMRAIQLYFRKEGRDPTDVELEMLAQTWSEHCVHKTFRARIMYSQDGAAPRVIDGLLKTYIRAATETIAKPWVRSAFVDNAGVVAFTDGFDLAFKVETHNHPSALEPFGGANTGVGGVVRDVIGVSARPIANTDVLCFGPANTDPATLPDGVLHPARIAEGVTHGIEDYGNKMGIPTVNGAFCYDEGYTANPLVFCGCLGLVPVGAHPRTPGAGDHVVVIGGRTGRDGIGGATFSSMEMGAETAAIAGSSVQIGHPIHEKQALEAVMIARDEKLYTAITDCGAGGLSSAIGEMAADLGAVVHLERVPLKYAGLKPWEIWLSEAQERMVLAVPPRSWPRLKAICDGLDIEATAIGEFTGDKRVRLLWDGGEAGNLSTEFLGDGIPRMELTAEWSPPKFTVASRKQQVEGDLTTDLLALIAQPGTRSSEDIVRRYDHEVQGATVVKPFVGPGRDGPSDAAVLWPQDVARTGSKRGVALSVGINPALGKVDPYAMAWACVDEAVRNCVAVGADPDQIAILDNFCWGNPRLPDRLGSLVRCCQGCHDAAIAYGTPFVSGKDSLNNEFLGADGKKHAIPGTLLISAMGIVPDVSRTVTSDFKRAGNVIFMVGITNDDPLALPKAPLNGYRALHQAIQRGLVAACHDCSEGGATLAVAEMALSGGLGASIDLDKLPSEKTRLSVVARAFGETIGRLIVEVAPEHVDAFDMAMGGNKHARIGEVTDRPRVLMTGAGSVVADTTLTAIARAFRGHLTEAF